VTAAITVVRHAEGPARSLVQAFVFGGRYGPKRVPRGIEPSLVAEILGALPADASVAAFRRALEVARFYESVTSLPAFLSPLAGELTAARDLARAAVGAQAVGELGDPELAGQATRALDARVVAHPEAGKVLDDLLAARLALAPAGSDAALVSRLRAEVAAAKRHEEESEAGMMAYDQVSALERNDLPLHDGQVAEKLRLLQAPAEEAVPGLVALYLGVAPVGGTYLDTWAARQLRRDALAGRDLGAVFAELERLAMAADPDQVGVRAHFRVVRAAQAIVYLGGEPSPALRERWTEAAPFGGQSFLWDDP
jgi:hypothetical protein